MLGSKSEALALMAIPRNFGIFALIPSEPGGRLGVRSPKAVGLVTGCYQELYHGFCI